MATSPIYSWPEPDNTDLVKNGALAIRTLGDAIDTTMGTMVAKTIIDAKGDLIAGTAADTAQRLAVGNNGETLVADSSTSSGLRWQAPVNANPLLNSAFQVWQRGTSFTATSVYTADRWYRDGNSGRTFSRQVTNDTTNLPFIQYCLRAQRDSGNASTSVVQIGQSLESVNSIPYAGKTVTFSFYARAGANYSAASGALAYSVRTGTGTDQNLFSGYTGQAIPINTSATLTTTWQRFTASATLSASATELGVLFEFTPVGTAGANDYFEVTGVQLEVGSVATPFKTYAGTIQGELAACQRYYYRAVADTAYGSVAPYAVAASSSGFISMIQPPVTMRVSPTSIDFSTLAFVNYADTLYAASSLTLPANNNKQVILVSGSMTGATAGHAGRLTGNNSTAAYLGFSAEL